jgi:hypothetical protein
VSDSAIMRSPKVHLEVAVALIVPPGRPRRGKVYVHRYIRGDDCVTSCCAGDGVNLGELGLQYLPQGLLPFEGDVNFIAERTNLGDIVLGVRGMCSGTVKSTTTTSNRYDWEGCLEPDQA